MNFEERIVRGMPNQWTYCQMNDNAWMYNLIYYYNLINYNNRSRSWKTAIANTNRMNNMSTNPMIAIPILVKNENGSSWTTVKWNLMIAIPSRRTNENGSSCLQWNTGQSHSLRMTLNVDQWFETSINSHLSDETHLPADTKAEMLLERRKEDRVNGIHPLGC